MPGAVILAGGRSSRYGRDKATLPYRGSTLLAHVVATARAVTDRIVVVGREQEGLGVTHVADLELGGGPLQAALAGARALGEDKLLLLACDLPFVTAALLRVLAAPLEAAHARIPSVGGRAQFLAALYGPAAWAAFETAYASGVRSLHGACRGLAVTWLDEECLTAAGIELTCLVDVDTPEDWPPQP